MAAQSVRQRLATYVATFLKLLTYKWTQWYLQMQLHHEILSLRWIRHRTHSHLFKNKRTQNEHEQQPNDQHSTQHANTNTTQRESCEAASERSRGQLEFLNQPVTRNRQEIQEQCSVRMPILTKYCYPIYKFSEPLKDLGDKNVCQSCCACCNFVRASSVSPCWKLVISLQSMTCCGKAL